MKKEKIYNLLLALLVLVAGLSFASCSDDDNNGGNGGGEGGDTSVHAGDDFYMYVNGEWHESLTSTEETQGYIVDISQLLDEKTDEAYEYLEEYQMVLKSLQQMEDGDHKANEDRVEEIVSDILDDIETEEDAFIAIGECIRMGLFDNTLRLYMAYKNDKIHYTLGPIDADTPDSFEDEEDEEDYDDEESMFEYYTSTSHKIGNFKYRTLSPQNLSDIEPLSGILEGLNIDPNYFAYSDVLLDETIAFLDELTLDELKNIIQNSIRAELMPYCRDEYASQVTNGNITTTSDYLLVMRDNLFTYSISYMFNQLYITKERKEQFKTYGEELKEVFANRIENSTWLSAQTQLAALDKLEKMRFFFGGPDKWYEAGFPETKGELLVDDILEVKASRTRMVEFMLGKDIHEEPMVLIMFTPGGACLNEYNAMYFPDGNSANILPAFMIGPEYSPEMDAADMYASFWTIAHEMTHAFDKDGAKFDAYGHKNNWWTAEDLERFTELNTLLSQQISTFEAAPGIMTDGERTVAEDVADLGGLNIAFDALNEYLKNTGVTGDALKAAQKRFFISAASRQCINYSPEELQEQLEDEHSVQHIRWSAGR